MRLTPESRTRTALAVLGSASLLTVLAACGEDDDAPEDGSPTLDAVGESPAPEGSESPSPEGSESPGAADDDGTAESDAPDDASVEDGEACGLVSAEELSGILGEELGQEDQEGGAAPAEGEVSSCLWGVPDNDFQGVNLFVIDSADEDPEETFEALASGDEVEVEGADEANFDLSTEHILVRSGEDVFQLHLYALEAEEDAYVEIAELIAAEL